MNGYRENTLRTNGQTNGRTDEIPKVSMIKKMISKIMSDHPEDFIQFNTDNKTLIENLFKEYAPPN